MFKYFYKQEDPIIMVSSIDIPKVEDIPEVVPKMEELSIISPVKVILKKKIKVEPVGPVPVIDIDIEQSEYEKQISYLNNIENNYFNETVNGRYSVKVYKLNCKEFVKLSLSPYKNQRVKNEDHINNLITGIIETRSLFHNFIIFHLKNKYITIADGQHRYISLCKINDNIINSMICWVHIIEFDEDVDDDYICDMFYKINTSRGMDKEEIEKQQKCSEYCKYIQDKFGVYRKKLRICDETIDDSRSQCQVSFHSLKIEIDKRWNIIKRYSKDELFKKLNDYNQKIIMLKSYDNDIFWKNTKPTKIIKEKCKNYDFYLGVNFNGLFDELKLNIIV